MAQSRVIGARHASCGATTIFGLPAAEVRALQATPQLTNGHLPGIDRLVASKLQHHMHAWHAYVAQRDTAERLLCESVSAVSKQTVEALEGIQREVDVVTAVLDRSKLMLLDEATLFAVRVTEPAARSYAIPFCVHSRIFLLAENAGHRHIRASCTGLHQQMRSREKVCIKGLHTKLRQAPSPKRTKPQTHTKRSLLPAPLHSQERPPCCCAGLGQRQKAPASAL
jgi:hypothetical protein